MINLDRGLGRFTSLSLLEFILWAYAVNGSFFLFVSAQQEMTLAQVFTIVLPLDFSLGNLAKIMLNKILIYRGLIIIFVLAILKLSRPSTNHPVHLILLHLRGVNLFTILLCLTLNRLCCSSVIELLSAHVEIGSTQIGHINGDFGGLTRLRLVKGLTCGGFIAEFAIFGIAD